MPRHDGTLKPLLRLKPQLSVKMRKAVKTLLVALLVLLPLVPHASAVDSPSPRHGARMIYDPVTKRILLFGGAKYENR